MRGYANSPRRPLIRADGCRTAQAIAQYVGQSGVRPPRPTCGRWRWTCWTSSSDCGRGERHDAEALGEVLNHL